MPAQIRGHLADRALAATALLREAFPDLKVRLINVVDLFRLQPAHEHGVDEETITGWRWPF